MDQRRCRGLGELTGMFAEHHGGPGTVKIAIEAERGVVLGERLR